MTARILVVDDIPANVKLLEARLTAEYYEVVTAANGFEALDACDKNQVDIVLLDIMMPGMDGFEVCERLKADPKTCHIPIVMVTALDAPEDRVRGLEAGADDFLTKPVNDMQLMTRVKSLVRLKSLTDELRLRAATTRDIGIEEMLQRSMRDSAGKARLLIVEEREQAFRRLATLLDHVADCDHVSDPQQALFVAAEGGYECVVVSSRAGGADPLRLCSQLRSLDRTRFVPIVLLAEPGEDERIARGLELGVNDYLVRPIDGNELAARIKTQVRRKKYHDELRSSVTQSIEMAVTDGLTGLHNRRYLDTHLRTLFERAQRRGRPLSLLIADIDRFKSINDTYGHDGGDDVLREFSRRLRRNVRGLDLACRYGGEEFVIVMPETDPAVAGMVAERIRAEIESTPFAIQAAAKAISVTASFGVATMAAAPDNPERLLKRADTALYEAKTGGRNRVVAKAA